MPHQKKDNQDKSKRRARGEGTVVQRADGRFVARVPLGNGKRKEEYYDTKQEAERAKRRMLNERDMGKLVVEQGQTLKDYLTYWLEAHRVTIRLTTYSMYCAYINHRVIPAIGHVILRKLTVDMFQSLYQRWEQDGLSPNTIRTIHGIVSEALGDAVKWRKLAYNPVQDVKVPKRRKAKVYMLSDEEIERLLNCAKQMKLYPLFRMALLLGMRRGELLGLKWSDIDFEKATLQVQHSLAYVHDPTVGKYTFVLGLPKTKAGERLIYLPYDIVEMLRDHYQKQLEIRTVVSEWMDLDLVFCTRHGNYLVPHDLWSLFEKLLKMAGLEHMKFHGLRHNASLILRRLGIDPVVRKEMLGHTSLSMTDDTYGHSTPRMHQEAANEINRLFGGKE